jgi:hypothetical protein
MCADILYVVATLTDCRYYVITFHALLKIVFITAANSTQFIFHINQKIRKKSLSGRQNRQNWHCVPLVH